MPRETLLTVPEVLDRLGIAKSTYYRWRQIGKAPKSIRLPNGQVRVRESVYNTWLDSLEEDELELARLGGAVLASVKGQR